MTAPCVSIIMTSWNYEKYLSSAIQSVLSQTFPDFELIVIDDGSNDSSREIIRDFQKQDDRIRVLFHDTNYGIARSMNDGINMAKGTFIASIDADDVWVADKLQQQLDVLSKYENYVVWSEGTIIDAAGQPTGKTFTQIVPDAQRRKNGYIFEDLISGNFINSSTRILKRKNIGEYSGMKI